ncbi:hypothetical protein BROUX41_006084 [Berkeleyomyces rouxiae]|uniref:uncharacterized protein n=1 Tax=Berkeleyomyces rouxiae TaxID=2035830 RepID=UPI003B7EF8D1
MNRGSRGRGGPSRGASLTARPVSASAEGNDSASGTPVPSGSSTPRIKTEPGAPSSSTATPISRGAWGGRFKPKNVRRSEAERAAIAEQEAQKQRERAAEEAKARPRGRFRGGRSRGNAMGQRGRQANPSGAFGQRGGFDGRGRGRGGADSKMSRDSTRFENREPRINADKLGLPAGADNSDVDDDFDFYDEEDKFPGLAPMGIYRTKPKKETVTVTTAAEMEAQARAGDSPSSSDDEEIDFKTAISNARASTAPDVAVKDMGKNAIKFEDDSIASEADAAAAAAKKKASKARAKLPVDPEAEQLEADLQLMRDEFAYVKIRDSYDDAENDDQASLEKTEEKIADEGIAREGRVYLFQFPPVMPPLRAVKKTRIKPEAVDDDDDDMFMTGSSAQDPAEVSSASPEAAAAADDHDETAAAAAATDNQSGFVGQMVVRKSGRVEMTWGGITYEMRPALKRDFVTSAVLVELSDNKRKAHGRPAATASAASDEPQSDGTAVGLGKVMGQFILAPKYEDRSEWVIGEEDLRAPAE